MIKDKTHFVKSVLLLTSFFVVLFLMFMPLFNNYSENALVAADKLFNSISKDSSYYIPDVVKKNEASESKQIKVALDMKKPETAAQAEALLTKAGAKVTKDGTTKLKAEGDLKTVLSSCLKDSDNLFHNRDDDVAARYGFAGRDALKCWWYLLGEVGKDLTRQKEFKAAKGVGEVIKKAVEPAYNYVGIIPEPASSRAGILVFSLVFYVIYTLWFGVGVLFLFEGFGLELTAGHKKEA